MKKILVRHQGISLVMIKWTLLDEVIQCSNIFFGFTSVCKTTSTVCKNTTNVFDHTLLTSTLHSLIQGSHLPCYHGLHCAQGRNWITINRDMSLRLLSLWMVEVSSWRFMFPREWIEKKNIISSFNFKSSTIITTKNVILT